MLAKPYCKVLPRNKNPNMTKNVFVIFDITKILSSWNENKISN